MKITIELDNIGDAVRAIEALNGLPIDTTKEAPAPMLEPDPAVVEQVKQERQAMPDMTDVDANGIPWDKRIHARTRVITSGGVWRRKRGVDPALVEQVEAELKGTPAEKPPAPVSAEVPAPPPPPTPVVAEAPPEAAPEDFPSFIKWVVGQDAKYNETDALNALVANVGLPSIGLLATNKHHIPTLVEIVKHGG